MGLVHRFVGQKTQDAVAAFALGVLEEHQLAAVLAREQFHGAAPGTGPSRSRRPGPAPATAGLCRRPVILSFPTSFSALGKR
jgi:hypothetical protein